MLPDPSDLHEYRDLSNPPPLAFRVAELLPGKDDEAVSCLLYAADLSNPPEFEGLSYAWGDPTATHTIICQGKRKYVMKSLHGALCHLRLPDRSRVLFADALWSILDARIQLIASINFTTFFCTRASFEVLRLLFISVS